MTDCSQSQWGSNLRYIQKHNFELSDNNCLEVTWCVYQLINEILLFSTMVFLGGGFGMDEARHLSWEKGMDGISIFPFHLVLQRSERSLFLCLTTFSQLVEKERKKVTLLWYSGENPDCQVLQDIFKVDWLPGLEFDFSRFLCFSHFKLA